MSKIGKLPITLPANVTLTVTDAEITVKGPKGELKVPMQTGITLQQEGQTVTVVRANEEKSTRALHGLVRSLVNNAIIGVTDGFAKTLEINGVGYKAELKGSNVITLHIGLSHPVDLPILEGVEVKLEKNQVLISGIDKQRVGEMAAIIRSYKKPEPYKGKGIKYIDEVIQRKAGKTAAAGKGAA
jgi:large subunit ribosomal protein L6